MKPGNTPESFTDLLGLTQKADIVHFDRDSKRLALTIDDTPGDRRSCIEMRLDGLSAEVRTLSGYDKVKHRWAEYCSPQGTVVFNDRRGLKAVLALIQELATTNTGYPNPESFTAYRRGPVAGNTP